MTRELKEKLIDWAVKYNDPVYFTEDPIAFPRKFAQEGASLGDIEIAAVFAAHFAWGRRAMIVRDCRRLFDRMEWRPFDYVMSGEWRSDDSSIHRTIKWSEVAMICRNLKDFYSKESSLETLGVKQIRQTVFGQKPDPKAPDKKINMMRRWLVRNDGKVDLGVWTHTSPSQLLIPLDVHVHNQALALGLTSRRSRDITTVEEITDVFREIFPSDPAMGDFALFGYGIDNA